MERLWSYLRRFSRMTKEMRPSHRTDVLVHALVYYGIKKKERMAQLLVLRWKKAKMTLSVAEETFFSLANSFKDDIVSEERIQQWILEESAIANEKPASNMLMPQWKCEYYQLLSSYFRLREKLTHESIDREEKLTAYQRLDKELSQIEAVRRLPCRWGQANREYQELSNCFSREKRSHIVEALWAASSRRQFLLKLKAKYADGQKIAKKLAVQIAKEMKTMKSLLPEYNACQTACGGDHMSIEQVLDPSLLTSPLRSIPRKGKQEIIDAFIHIQRAREEVVMLETEMTNVINYYKKKSEVIQDSILSFTSRDDAFGRGAISLLKTMMMSINRRRQQCQKLFCNSSSEVDACDDLDSDSDPESSSDED